MKLSDLNAMRFRRDEYGQLAMRRDDGNWTIFYGRVIEWAREMMALFCGYGDWSVQETDRGAACRGTVRARLKGPNGTVEAWNGRDVFFIPKGVRLSKLPWPDGKAEDERNGVLYWPERKVVGNSECEWVSDPVVGGYYHDGVRAEEWVQDCFEAAVHEACAMAGLSRN